MCRIAMQWHCRWTRCCYKAHWHGMVVYEWWFYVDCHFWTLCKLLCCNADGWNMQTYLYYLDNVAMLAVQSTKKFRECEAVESDALYARRPLSTVTEHEHATTEHCYRACIIEYCSWLNVRMCLRSELYKKKVGSSVLVLPSRSVTKPWSSQQKKQSE